MMYEIDGTNREKNAIPVRCGRFWNLQCSEFSQQNVTDVAAKVNTDLVQNLTIWTTVCGKAVSILSIEH